MPARLAVLLALALNPARADGPKFERVVIDADFPGAYQVEVADVNGDGKADIVALGGGTCAWYENPGWTKRVITGPKQTPGIISSATTDLNGDGRAEVAIAYEFAMNEPKKGKLGVALPGESADDPWTFRHLADVGSIHRLRWGEFDGDPARPELVVAPLFGPEARPPAYDDPARLRLFAVGDDPKAGPWTPIAAAGGVDLLDHRILHAIEVAAPGAGRDGRSTVLTAGDEGVVQLRTVRRDGAEGLAWAAGPIRLAGAPGERPNRGCSEVHRGKLADGRAFVATIEPWHGSAVAVHLATAANSLDAFAPRRVIDDTLDAGHALWVADVDGDGGDEILAGHRGKDHRVSLYRFDGKDWKRTVLDREIAAQDLRGGDVDGDGLPDVAAVGGSTRNVLLYQFHK